MAYDKKVLHVITIFDDSDEEAISKIQSKIFDKNKGNHCMIITN